MSADRAKLRLLADLLDQDDSLFDAVADGITDARNKAARIDGDRDSGDVVEDLIKSLRGVA